MRPEFEGKVLGVDPGLVEARVAACGGEPLGAKLQRRYVYDLVPGRWLRLRDSGGHVTLCVKVYDNDGVGGTSEIETSIGDFDIAHELLVAAGHTRFAYQENKRTSFALDGAWLELDTWPGIPTYLEIEAGSQDQVYAVAARLGYTPSQLTGISTVHVYAAYGLDLESLTRLDFASPPRADASTWTEAVTISKARAVAITPVGKLLLIRRHRHGQGKPFWVLPGGGIEPGDQSLEDAACRELLEESGGALHIDRLANIAYTRNNDTHHAIFTGRLDAIDAAARSGPELDDRDGSHDLEEVDLDPLVLERMDIWPPMAKTWLIQQLHLGHDLHAVPDLRDGRIRWQPWQDPSGQGIAQERVDA